MTSDEVGGIRLLGSLRPAGDGTGIVRMEDRFDSDIDDVWSALTDPGRLARWIGEIEGDLRPGGTFHRRLFASGSEGAGVIEACERPHRLVVTLDPGQPDGSVIEVLLAVDGEGTVLVWEEQGLPVDKLPAYGAGIQIHVEDLGAHLAGRGPCDADVRWEQLQQAYENLAPTVSGDRHGSAVVELPNDLEIVVTREFDAPRQLVFDVSTKPEHVRRHVAPFRETVTVCSIDLRVGGDYHFVFVTDDGTECSFRGTFLEVEAPTRTVQTWRFEGWPGVEAVESQDLREVDGVTTLTWRLRFRDQAGRAHWTKTDGLEANFDKMEDVLRSLLGPGGPGPG